jgi:hypothetical protein
MTCLEKWNTIPPGSIVRFPGGEYVKLADQWDRYHTTENCVVWLGVGTIRHLGEMFSLTEEFTNQFEPVWRIS